MSAYVQKDNTTDVSLIDGQEIETTLNNTAALNVDILLLGETGTGKDTLAQRIHRLSGRRGNFVALNSTHKCNAHPCMHFVRRLPAQALARA